MSNHENEAGDRIYKIVRYFRDDRPAKSMRYGLTLAEAQEHCRDRNSRAADGSWFDGYTKGDKR